MSTSPSATSSFPSVRRAFTLIELLVLISIIAMLIAILLPALSQARQVQRQLACASNLRQIGLAVYVYADDHKGHYPSHELAQSSWPWGFTDWGLDTQFYHQYLTNNEIYFCPQNLFTAHESEGYQDYPYFPGRNTQENWRTNISYSYFYGSPAEEGETWNARKGFKTMEAVTVPSRSTVLADMMRFGQSDTESVPLTWWNHLGKRMPDNLDSAGGNMAYADGHVAWMSGKQKLLAHRQPMRNNWTKSHAAEQPHDTRP